VILTGKCNKVDYRVFIWGIKMAKVVSLSARSGRVSDISVLIGNLAREVVVRAGKLSTQ